MRTEHVSDLTSVRCRGEGDSSVATAFCQNCAPFRRLCVFSRVTPLGAAQLILWLPPFWKKLRTDGGLVRQCPLTVLPRDVAEEAVAFAM